MAYKVDLPKESRIDNTFHISKLKSYKEQISPSNEAKLPSLSIHNQPVLHPITILNCKGIINNNRKIPQLLIQWSNSLWEDASWEDKEEIQKLLPSLQLEDKLFSEEASHDAIFLELVEQDLTRLIPVEIEEEEIEKELPSLIEKKRERGTDSRNRRRFRRAYRITKRRVRRHRGRSTCS